MLPNYDLDKIKFATDGPTFERAVDLYKRGKVTKIVSELPVSEKTARLLVDMLLRLDKKLCGGGVDDSDGTVGGFEEPLVKIFDEQDIN